MGNPAGAGRDHGDTSPGPSPKSQPILVLVADGQRLFAESLAGMIEAEDDLAAVIPVVTSAAKIVPIARRSRPNIALVDYWMPDMEGPAVAAMMRRSVPECRVMLLSWLFSVEQMRRAFDAGAVGFIPKSLGLDRLLEAVRDAHAGKTPVFAGETEALARALQDRHDEAAGIYAALASLTAREQEILRLLARGYPYQGVAEELFISQATVKDHIHNMLKKTNQRSHDELVAWARRSGWIRA